MFCKKLIRMEFEEEDFESQFADQLDMMKEMEGEAHFILF